jgi:hypothetical protein
VRPWQVRPTYDASRELLDVHSLNVGPTPAVVVVSPSDLRSVSGFVRFVGVGS